MASSKSVYLEKKHLDEDFGAQVWTAPAILYLALFTARGTTTQAANNTNFVEVAVGAYIRKSIANNLTTWNAATSIFPSQKSNAIRIEFITPTADWGSITCMGIYDAVSGGNLLYWADLVAPVTVLSGAAPAFEIGALVITET